MNEPSREEVEKHAKYMEREAYQSTANLLRLLLALAYDKDTGEKYIERAAISEELRKEALARLAEVEKALEPFANVFDGAWGSSLHDDFDMKICRPDYPAGSCRIAVSAFRRARAALQHKDQQG